jgi:hypothetical protein
MKKIALLILLLAGVAQAYEDGYTTLSDTTDNYVLDSRTRITKVALSSSGSLDSVSYYILNDGSSITISFAVLNADSTVLDTTANVTTSLNGRGWVTGHMVIGANVTASNTYWLAVSGRTGGTSEIYYHDTGTASNYACYRAASTAPWPNVGSVLWTDNVSGTNAYYFARVVYSGSSCTQPTLTLECSGDSTYTGRIITSLSTNGDSAIFLYTTDTTAAIGSATYKDSKTGATITDTSGAQGNNDWVRSYVIGYDTNNGSTCSDTATVVCKTIYVAATGLKVRIRK